MENIYVFLPKGVSTFANGQSVENVYEMIRSRGFISFTDPKLALQSFGYELGMALNRYTPVAAQKIIEIAPLLPDLPNRDEIIAQMKAVQSYLAESCGDNTRLANVMQGCVDGSFISPKFQYVDSQLGAYLADNQRRVGKRASVIFENAGKRSAFLEKRIAELEDKDVRNVIMVKERAELALLISEKAKLNVALKLADINTTIAAAQATKTMGEAEQALLKVYPTSITEVKRVENGTKIFLKLSILNNTQETPPIDYTIGEEVIETMSVSNDYDYAKNYSVIFRGDTENRILKVEIIHNESMENILLEKSFTFPAPVQTAPVQTPAPVQTFTPAPIQTLVPVQTAPPAVVMPSVNPDVERLTSMIAEQSKQIANLQQPKPEPPAVAINKELEIVQKELADLKAKQSNAQVQATNFDELQKISAEFEAEKKRLHDQMQDILLQKNKAPEPVPVQTLLPPPPPPAPTPTPVEAKPTTVDNDKAWKKYFEENKMLVIMISIVLLLLVVGLSIWFYLKK